MVGIFKTTNAGTSWFEFNSGLMVNTYTVRAIDFKLTGGDTTLYLGVAHPSVAAGQGVFEFSYSPVGISDPIPVLPQKFRLEQNYPNPFNPETNIRFDVAAGSYVELAVYNSAGELVKRLVSGFYQPGSHSVKMDGNGLSSGVYFYTIKAGSFTDVKKMVLLK